MKKAAAAADVNGLARCFLRKLSPVHPWVQGTIVVVGIYTFRNEALSSRDVPITEFF